MVLIFIAENHLMRELEGVGAKNLDFFGPKWKRAKLMYIKLLIYLFFYVALGRHDFDGGKSITRAIGRGGGHNNLDSFGPNGTCLARCHFRAQ
jgi:hypothetical protein